MTERRRINLSPSDELYRRIEKAAGNASLPGFCLGLVDRALRGAHEQPDLGLRPVQQVRIDPEPFMAPFRDLEARLEEMHRAIEQYGQYLVEAAPADNRSAALRQAMDKAQLAVDRYRERQHRNGGGS